MSLTTIVALAVVWCACAGVYLHNPRGSNNKLSEQSNTVQNPNRLFDSQADGAAGYQIGDACWPVCQDANGNYNASMRGAMEGAMRYYSGSELYIEWHNQHGCGVGNPSVVCQLVLQYMCEDDNIGIRDGSDRAAGNVAGGKTEPPIAEEANAETLGQHEPLDFYSACKRRERNRGLYTADQIVRNDQGATATRQNPSGNTNANQRHGLECPEERDYYPYWHPSPWHDIAVLTSEPSERCSYYQAESQNVKGKGYCDLPEINNPRECVLRGGSWQTAPAFNEAPPECTGAWTTQENHNGNARGGRPLYWLWKIPDRIRGRCALRLRYNITTKDFNEEALAYKMVSKSTTLSEDHFFVDEKQNDRFPSQRRRDHSFGFNVPLLPQDPVADFIGLRSYLDNLTYPRALQLQIKTNHYGRTFQDRSHTFVVLERPAELPESARVVNYNVRGRRGNIMQIYPSVEYDFVPQDLIVEEGTFLHFQWTGSDANAKGNDGHGRQGTDRSNLVQISAQSETVPLPIKQHTLFFRAQEDLDKIKSWHKVIDRFAYLDQDFYVACQVQELSQDALSNCKQLNGASAYFDGGVIEMRVTGTHYITSTRNNDFSTRSQKASITVVPNIWSLYAVLGLIIGIGAFIAVLCYLAGAVYAFRHPASWLFSKRYRPRIIRCCVRSSCYLNKIRERRATLAAQKERREQSHIPMACVRVAGSSIGSEPTSPTLLGRITSVGMSEKGEVLPPPEEGPRKRRVASAMTSSIASARRLGRGLARPCGDTCSRINNLFCRCWPCGLWEQSLVAYVVLNVALFTIGLLSHWGKGFHGAASYAIAKGAGFTLDLNLALVVLPTLKSLQTALRSSGSTREWLPIDDPIAFHVIVSFSISIGAIVHTVAHYMHMHTIAVAPPIQHDVLAPAAQSDEEVMSGTSLWNQVWNPQLRFAPITGIIVSALMTAMFVTAAPCCRRATNCCSRKLGGYNLFWRIHGSWQVVYLLLLVHAPGRLWVWLFFPTLCVLMDRKLLANRQRPYVVLTQAQSLPRDVIRLKFDVPLGFTYQAGQYVLLGWRGEWHPFTLTSAPEESYLSVHIRAPNSLDWCSALRQHLIHEAPTAALGHIDHKGSLVKVEYEKCLQLRDAIFSRPCSYSIDGKKRSTSKSSLPRCSTKDLMDSETESIESLEDSLPSGAVALQLSGPFGAPAQKVWQFENIMVVGAGIGVTPFVSILRSVQLRLRQRDAIFGAAQGSATLDAARNTHTGVELSGQGSSSALGKDGDEDPRTPNSIALGLSSPSQMLPSRPKQFEVATKEWSSTNRLRSNDRPTPKSRASRPRSWAHEVENALTDAIEGVGDTDFPRPPTETIPPLMAVVEEAARSRRLDEDSNAHASELKRLVQSTVNVPKKIHFYWIVRSQEEFDWFYDLLAAAVEGPARDIVVINVFTTGEVELSQVKSLPCAHHHQFFGRPNWGRIFKGIRNQSRGEHIGVFLCGSPAIGSELARQSVAHTDPPDQPEGTRFSFFKEYF